MQSFIEAQYAAEMVGMAAFARAVLCRAVDDEPDVVSLRLAVTHQSTGQAVVEWEFIGRSGLALGGGGL